MGEMMKLPAAIYVRRSSNASNERSCEDQAEACRNALAKLNYYVKSESSILMDDICSGLLFTKREQFGELIKLLSARRPLDPRPYEAIFVDDISRVARSMAFTIIFVQALRFHKIKLFDAMGNEYTSIQGYSMVLTMGLAAELERHFNSTRTSRGIRAAMKRGAIPGKIYGFESTTLPEEGADHA